MFLEEDVSDGEKIKTSKRPYSEVNVFILFQYLGLN